MTEIKEKTSKMIEFKPITLNDKSFYESKLSDGFVRGGDFSFANLYLRGRQSMAKIGDEIVIFSQFNRRSVYPFPVGPGDKKAALDAIINDSAARGIPCRISGLCHEARRLLEELYPGKFRYHCDESAFDYIYYIDDLADLKGKKYHSKRNHVNRFKADYPNYVVEPINEANLCEAIRMVELWYEEKVAENPDSDFHMEKAAIKKAFRDYKELELEGLMIKIDGKSVALTLASRVGKDMFDVHFEKALKGINGAYAAINYEFANFIRGKYPEIRFLNREEDMGLEGLRRAKRSYYPCHMVKKCWACLLEDGYDY